MSDLSLVSIEEMMQEIEKRCIARGDLSFVFTYQFKDSSMRGATRIESGYFGGLATAYGLSCKLQNDLEQSLFGRDDDDEY